MGTLCRGEHGGRLVWGVVCPVLGGAPRPSRSEICGAWVCSESGLPDDPSWGRLRYIRWLDTAQDLYHRNVTHPLDNTDFSGYWPIVPGGHRCFSVPLLAGRPWLGCRVLRRRVGGHSLPRLQCRACWRSWHRHVGERPLRWPSIRAAGRRLHGLGCVLPCTDGSRRRIGRRL